MDYETSWLNVQKPDYKFNDKYGLCYIVHDEMKKVEESLSVLRKGKYISSETYHVLRSVFMHLYRNWIRLKELDRQEPRRIAQKFIGSKKIRKFIFNRDNFMCLNCKSDTKLELDHIIPISAGGKNCLSNLQTLCKSCNSKKRDNFKDYRNGAR